MHSVYTNDAIWLGVRLHLSPPLSQISDELETSLERFRNVMIHPNHEASHDVVNHDPKMVLTLQEMLPYVIKWTFGKRESGWINVFHSISREGRVKEAISMLRREAKDFGMIKQYPIQDVNLGHLVFSTMDEIFQYASLRGIELPEVEGIISKSDRDNHEKTEHPQRLLTELRSWYSLLKGVGDGKFDLSYVKQAIQMRDYIPRKEMETLLRRFIQQEHHFNYPEDWNYDSLVKKTLEWLGIERYGVIAFSPTFIASWPKVVIDQLADYMNLAIPAKVDGGYLNAVKESAVRQSAEQWWSTIQQKNEFFDLSFWESIKKRALIEIFLASDIAEIGGIHNHSYTEFLIDFNSPEVVACLQQTMHQFCLLRMRDIAEDEFPVDKFHEWFKRTFPNFTKVPIGKGMMYAPEFEVESYNYRPIFSPESHEFAKAGKKAGTKRIIAVSSVYSQETDSRKKNKVGRQSLQIEQKTNTVITNQQIMPPLENNFVIPKKLRSRTIDMVDSSQVSSGKTDKVERTRQWKGDDITDREFNDLIALAVKESLRTSSGNPNLDRTIRGTGSSSSVKQRRLWRTIESYEDSG